MKTFYDYLVIQKGRQDYIGDLASSAMDDSAAPKEGDLEQWRGHLISNSACAEILEALELAWVEHQEEFEICKEKFSIISLEELSEVLGLTVKEDKTNKIITFLCLLSAYTENSQFNITFNAPSSSGKSYIPLEVSSLYPKADVIKVGYCSPTAFFHDQSTWNKDTFTYHMSLERKILIFLDQPHMQLLGHLRPFLSHDEKEIKIKITDKSQKHGLKTKNVIIRGYPSVIFCSAGLKIDEQEATRFLLLSPETTQEKLKCGIQEALSKESDSQAYTANLKRNSQRQSLIQRIIAIKAENIQDIKIPDDLRKYIEQWFFQNHKILNPRHQRDIKRISSIIKSIALLNLWHREIIGQHTILISRGDVDAGFKIWEEISFSQELNLSPYVYKIYTEVILPLYNDKKSGLTRKELLQGHIKVYKRPLDEWKLGREIIPMLESAGLVTEEGDPQDKRRKLIVPIYPTTQFELNEPKNNIDW